MSKAIKVILAVVLCAAVFVGIYFLYGVLKEEYSPDQLSNDTAQTQDMDHSAPNFTVVDGQGNQVKLSDYFGKPIVLNFWATWCGYCKKEMPDFNTAYKKHPDVQFLMVNVTDGVQETMEAAKKYISDEGFTFPVLYDVTLQAANTYGASGLPMTVFIDKEGNLVTYANGMLSAENLERGIGMIK